MNVDSLNDMRQYDLLDPWPRDVQERADEERKLCGCHMGITGERESRFRCRSLDCRGKSAW